MYLYVYDRYYRANFFVSSTTWCFCASVSLCHDFLCLNDFFFFVGFVGFSVDMFVGVFVALVVGFDVGGVR